MPSRDPHREAGSSRIPNTHPSVAQSAVAHRLRRLYPGCYPTLLHAAVAARDRCTAEERREAVTEAQLAALTQSVHARELKARRDENKGEK